MEDHAKLIESLLERAAEYGKTSIELVKLKAADKTSDVASSLLTHSVFLVIIAVFMLFLNIGLALWLSDILGKTWSGFVAVAGFYCIAGLVVHFFMRKWLKERFRNSIIKQVLK
jgi:hypothetical protein